MNIENLKKVLAIIKRHGPNHFDMNYWFSSESRELIGVEEADCVNINACGTTACLAGHAALIMTEESGSAPNIEEVSKWLDVPLDEEQEHGDQDIFHRDYWNCMGEVGKKAQTIAEDVGDYDGVVYLLEELIKQGE